MQQMDIGLPNITPENTAGDIDNCEMVPGAVISNWPRHGVDWLDVGPLLQTTVCGSVRLTTAGGLAKRLESGVKLQADHSWSSSN